MQIPVSELLVRYLERLGIDVIFGMPGAHILPVYDHLYDSSIKTILAKHEQGAAFMACGYSRATHDISACITTAGPGATNLVTGIANAYADKLPLLAITGESPTYIFGKGGLQESSGEGGAIDQVNLFRSITRYSKLVERTDYLVSVLNQTSKILLSTTPGPVLLSIPFNVQNELVDDSILNEITTTQSTRLNTENYTRDETQTLATLIAEASNPVIVAGYGCLKSNAGEELSKLSESAQIPVTSSLKGKGAISEDAALSLGCLGVTTQGYAYQYILDKADLVIILGASFNERTSYVWNREFLNNKRVVQIDSNPAQLEKVFQADLAIEGDIKTVLSDLLTRLDIQTTEDTTGNKPDIQTIHEEKQNHNTNSPVFNSNFELVEALFSEMNKSLPDDCMIFDDNIIFAQNFYQVSGNTRYYPNTGISSLGQAVPAAIGARLAYNHPTIAIIGDGGFQMCCMEVMTAVNYELPLTIILFNNDSMGLVRKNQHQQYRQRYIDCDFVNPDYAQLARSFGIDYCKIDSPASLNNIFSEISDKTLLIDVIIDKDAFPDYHSNR